MTGSIEAERTGRRERPVDDVQSRRAARRWWDLEAAAYQAEHGDFLGDSRFVWGPEGLDEADAGLLGPVAGRTVLEVGAGAAQCARWLAGQSARPVALDLSAEQLRHSALADRRTGTQVPAVQGDALALPFGDDTFDLACSSYGALPFVASAALVHREVARVLRPGGRWVFSVPHPMRWCFPDVPGSAGLTVTQSYFDRRPYVETSADGQVTYAEHHRTLGDHVAAVVSAGFTVLGVVEPAWPTQLDHTWGGWSPLRGRLIPGTAIFVTRLP